MTVSATKKISTKKTSRYGDKGKINILIRRHLFEGMNRRKGFPLQFSASILPTRYLPPDDTEALCDMNSNPKVKDSLVHSMLKKPFKKVCQMLSSLDIDKDFDLISETILHFSLRIYGLPECHREDLLLSVYFFIEDTFGIQSKFELCAELEEEGESMVVGVVFETIQMKYDILQKDILLEDSEVRLRNNTDLDWIVEALCR